ncbi:MAG: CvpA family protein [Lachnospiraceae bacterium]|nr:CvpA family protein [Lachnospiraceae bacterium]
MNYYTILIYVIAALIIIWRISVSFKRGLVQELSNTIAILIVLGVGYALKNIIFGFIDKRFGTIVIYIGYLALLLLIYKIVSFIFASLKIFARLPVIKFIDKLLGAILGAVEGAAIVLFLIWFIT